MQRPVRCLSDLLSFYIFPVPFRPVSGDPTAANQSAKYNETIFTSYIDSFSMVPFQLVNDEEIGELANTNNSSYLDMFRARELLRKNSITISISSFLPPISTAVFCFT